VSSLRRRNKDEDQIFQGKMAGQGPGPKMIDCRSSCLPEELLGIRLLQLHDVAVAHPLPLVSLATIAAKRFKCCQNPKIAYPERQWFSGSVTQKKGLRFLATP